ncbi:MAG TPA: dual specificity protein phosphatase family protein [Candidatus Binatia bacterium]|nr:dual specificity protein phosphatase family protein [Candidatus Binatia bacterium]
MASGLYSIEGPWPGRLAIAARPRGEDCLDDEITSWKRSGISAVASLLTHEEQEELGLGKEGEAVRQQGLEFFSLPVPDRGVPGSQDRFSGLVEKLAAALQNKRNVLIHCRQGIGRSSLLAAGVLMT